jgi:serine/threonine-protein kinase
MSADDNAISNLEPGSRIGVYEIQGKIGVGGMGEVYQASDTRLKRAVAIKVLPAGLTADPERLARFEREAQVLAQLHHPNIASIFGLEESDGVVALVLELVEGPTLAERLEAGALGIEEVLRIASQIAHGLEQAHGRGIVHRDLKPQNVKAPVSGDVKVLDFGLAKAMSQEPGEVSSPDLTMSPTILEAPSTASYGTQVGVIMGTAAYMAPEQAKGQALDKRADIWAFGVLLYEMLVGRSLFGGDSLSETLAGVLKTEIDLSVLPPTIPSGLRRLLRRCLERDPDRRLHDIADARIVLDEIAAGEVDEVEAVAPPRSDGIGRWLPWGVAAVASLVAITLAWNSGFRSPEPVGRSVFGLAAPAKSFLMPTEWPPVALSEDGRTLLAVAYADAGTAIYRRAFDRLDFTLIQGTEGAENPVISPDGKTVVFFEGSRVFKVPVEGGTPVAVADAQTPRGMTWGPNNTIVYSPMYNSGLWRVPATGGAPTELTPLDASRDERTHRWPQALPDGRTVIFTVGLMTNTSDYDISTIDAVDVETGVRRTILENARMARYTDGYLVFQRLQSLLAVRFDLDRLEATGEPFVIYEGVAGERGSGSAFFATDRAGGIVLVPETGVSTDRTLVVVDRAGEETELRAEPGPYQIVRYSPDGRRLAMMRGSGGLGDDDIYMYDLDAQTARRLTFSESRGFPAWSPDGRRVMFIDGQTGRQRIVIRAADGSGGDIELGGETLNQEYFLTPQVWFSDDDFLAIDVQRSIDIRQVNVADGTVTPVLADPDAAEDSPTIAPGGDYIAYGSNATGTSEVFVTTFPVGGGRWQVSSTGGGCPSWARDGSELYFAQGTRLLAVEVDTSDGFRFSEPRTLVSGPYDLCLPARRQYDVGPDGRFVIPKRVSEAGSSAPMVLLRGWQSGDPGGAAER